MRSFLLSLILVLVSAGLSAGAAEYITRLLYPNLVPTSQVRFVAATADTPVLGPRNATFRQTKNTGDYDVTVTFNRLGFRDDKDVSKGRADDLYLIGDSLALGWGVEEADRLSEKLEDRLGRKVYNIAMPTGILEFDRILSYVKRQGADIGRVILLFSMETAIHDAEPETPPAAQQVAVAANPITAAKFFLMRHSAFYFLVTSFIHKQPALKKLAVDVGLITPNLEGISYRPYSASAVAAAADGVARHAKAYPDMLVVLAPSRALWYGTPEERAETLRIHTEFLAALKKRGLDPVDLKGVFEAGGDPLGYFFTNDGHWRPKGHALAAKIIASRVARR